jgi:phage head maturation protease
MNLEGTANDILIYKGGPVKSLSGRGPGWFGGLGIIFSTEDDPDLQKEFFSPRTDVDLYEGQRVRTYFRHGVDPVAGRTKLTQATFKRQAKGIWFEGRLDVSNPLHKRIDNLVQRGKLGFSTGSMGHLTHKEQRGQAQEILEWPVGELSLTPTPCEPRTRAVTLKSLFDENEWALGLDEADLDEWERKQAEMADNYLDGVRKVRPDYVAAKDIQQRAVNAYADFLMKKHEFTMSQIDYEHQRFMRNLNR